MFTHNTRTRGEFDWHGQTQRPQMWNTLRNQWHPWWKQSSAWRKHFHLTETLGKSILVVFGNDFPVCLLILGSLTFNSFAARDAVSSPLFFNTNLSHADEVSWLVSKATRQLFVPAAFCLRRWRSPSPFRPPFPPIVPPPTTTTSPPKANYVLSNTVSMCNPGIGKLQPGSCMRLFKLIIHLLNLKN